MKILFTGDVMLGRLINNFLNWKNYTYVWGDTFDIIRSADLSLINLECAISSKDKEWNKTFKVFHFRANPEAIEVLKTAQIGYVSLANNHVLDYDYEALFDTLDLLCENKIAHSGAGRNLGEAIQTAILDVKRKSPVSDISNSKGALRNVCDINCALKAGDINKRKNRINKSIKTKSRCDKEFTLKYKDNIRIGIISLTDNQPEWEASESKPGINYIPINISSSNKAYYHDRLRYCIKNARSISDIVIVASHVGPHFRNFPSKEYSEFAHRILDLGADIYWGHSNHMPQGIEIYNDKKLIMYDCGDFIDDYAVDPDYRNDLSFIFLLHLDEDAYITHSIASATANKSEIVSNSNNNNNNNSNNNNNNEVDRESLCSGNVRNKGSDLKNHSLNDVNGIGGNKERTILKGTIELIPTIISEFKVNRALLEEADLAINRMVERCNDLGTKCTVDSLRKRILIQI